MKEKWKNQQIFKKATKKKLNLYHSTWIMDERERERERGNSTPNWGNGGSHNAHRVSLALTIIKMPTLPFLPRVVVVVYMCISICLYRIIVLRSFVSVVISWNLDKTCIFIYFFCVLVYRLFFFFLNFHKSGINKVSRYRLFC